MQDFSQTKHHVCQVQLKVATKRPVTSDIAKADQHIHGQFKERTR